MNKKQLIGLENLDKSKPIIINSDVQKALKKIPNKMIDVIVTSPPYWNQRDYTNGMEIGKEETSTKYIETINDIGIELKRVLKDTGVYFLNIGDKYVDKTLQLIPDRIAIEMQKNGWGVRNKIIWKKTNPNPCPVTDRFTNSYEVIFMFVKNPDNYLTPDYFFNLDSVRIPHKTKDAGINKDLPRTIPKNKFKEFSKKILKKEYNGKFKEQTINVGASAGGRVGINGEYYSLQRKHPIDTKLKNEIIKLLRVARKNNNISIDSIDEKFNAKHTAGHWFRLDRGGSSLPSPEQWKKLKKILRLQETKYDDIMTETHYVLQTVRNHSKGKNPTDVWEFSTSNIKEKHFAPFPEKLPEMCIKSSCPPNGVVLDPFAGSGTTLKIAKSLGFKSIGIEINTNYLDIMKRVIGRNVTILTL